ncbi:helix-turn-helix domain-containing protein [Longirhabdus pacifica]|uniref:helix-turn-helix domain-containing protein n=1 Tax=Longirhabdus pacifica TaxID=2305227 RepID=UPI001008A3EF|nr:helix-turn-helix transcriptional regulator [Longirhabdus pacifica]
MNPVICCYSTHLQKENKEWLDRLPKNLDLKFVTQLDEVLELMTNDHYSIVILITNDSSFPASWDMSKVKAEKTIMITTGMDKVNLLLLNSFLSSLETHVEPVNENPYFYQSLEYLDQHLCDNKLSLERVASQAYVSKCYYSRIFQKYVGKGFKEYIIDKRIQKAKQMLENGESVTDVCFSIGYNDLTHFARMFKKVVGVNPSTYRANHMAAISV